MARPPLELGTHGAIRCYKTASGYRARTLARHYDGQVRGIERRAHSKEAAERSLKLALRDRSRIQSAGDITAETRVSAPAEAWYAGLKDLHELLLAELRAGDCLDLDRCAVDGSHVRALKGGHVGPCPVDRGRPGSKHHLICDAGGMTPAVTLTGGNRNDITQLIPLIDAVPPIRGRRGRPRRKSRGIIPRIAHRGVAHGSGLRRTRWVVEPGFAWLHAFERLRTRYERRADIHLGLLQLACALICYRQLPIVLK